MNRFRKKSNSNINKKLKEDELANTNNNTGNNNSNGNGIGLTSSTSQFTLLPEVKDFRTSLILPHLTRRFELLRREDGKLVSLEEMHVHLAAQRKTGMLTASEVDAVLIQYSLQSQHELSPPLPTPRAYPMKKRRDWSLPDDSSAAGGGGTTRGGGGEDSEESFENNSNRRIDSFSSTNDLDHQQQQTSSSNFPLVPNYSTTSTRLHSNSFASTSTSSTPFPYSSESYYSLPTPTPEPSTTTTTAKVEPYKRGAGNSMFGGRVRQMKVSKSPSSFSLKSTASAGSKKSLGITGSNSSSNLKGVGQSGSEIETTNGEVELESETGDERASSSSVNNRDSSSILLLDTETEDESPDQLALNQLKRVSLKLDDIESELSKTYLRMKEDNDLNLTEEIEQVDLNGSYSNSFNAGGALGGGKRSISPTGSDTEPIDPFFHRLRPPTTQLPVVDNYDSSERDVITPVPNSNTPSQANSPIVQSSSTTTSTNNNYKPFNNNSPSFIHPFIDNSQRLRDSNIDSSTQSHETTTTTRSSLLDEFPDSFSFPPTPSSRDNSFSTSNTNTSRNNSLALTSTSRNGSFVTGSIDDGFGSTGGLNSARGSLAAKGSLSSRSKKTYGSNSRKMSVNSNYTTSPIFTTQSSLPSSSSNQHQPQSIINNNTNNNNNPSPSILTTNSNKTGTSSSTTNTINSNTSNIFGVEPFRNDSMSSVGSLGSSYHPASNGSNEEDDLGGILKERSSIEEEQEGGGAGGGGNEIELLNVPNHSFSTRSSPTKEELLKDLNLRSSSSNTLDGNYLNGNGNGNGGNSNGGNYIDYEDDSYENGENGDKVRQEEEEEEPSIEVEDLVLIQESLVRSASRRQATLRGVVTTPTPTSTLSTNSISSPSISLLQSESRKQSIENTTTVNSNSNNGSRKSSVDHSVQQSPPLGTTTTTTRSPSDHSILSITPSSFPTPSSVDSREFISAVTSPMMPQSLPLDVPEIFVASPPAPDAVVLPEEEEQGGRAEEDQFIEIGGVDSTIATPRSPLPSRSPITRQSVLIRDVRSQANAATTNLKSTTGTKLSPNLSSSSTASATANAIRKKKSIRNIPISNPQFISGPTGILSVPILNPELDQSLESNATASNFITSTTSTSNKNQKNSQPPKLGPKSPGRLIKDSELTSKNSVKSGIGSRFKKLLSKQSRDQLNGDEVTPFVDFESGVGVGVSGNTISPPFSPPSNNSTDTSFGSPRSPPPTSPVLLSSDSIPEVPALPEAYKTPILSSVAEMNEGLSAGGVGGDSPSSNRSISRVLSRFRTTSRRPSDTPSSPNSGIGNLSMEDSLTPTMNSSPTSTVNGRSPILSRTSGKSDEGLGLGLGLGNSENGGSRAPVTYDIGTSMRRRRIDQDDNNIIPQTAPLSLSKSSPMSDYQASQVPNSAPLERTSGGGGRLLRTPSLDSLDQLTEVAQELGLHPEGVRELVDLSYNNNSSTSNSMKRSDVTLNGQPLSMSSEGEEEESDIFTPTVLDFRNPDSPITSNTTRSFSDRTSTSPPNTTLAHRRKTSSELPNSSTTTTRIPENYSSSNSNLTTPNKKLGIVVDSSRFSRLSVDTKGSNNSIHGGGISGQNGGSPRLLPPRSPGENSIRSYKSYRSSGYGSVIDFYGDDGGSEDGVGLGVEGAGLGITGGSSNNSKNNRMVEQQQQDGVASAEVNQLHQDLMKHRLSSNSNQSAFHSRQSSVDSAASFYPQQSTSSLTPSQQQMYLDGTNTPSETQSIIEPEAPTLFLRHQGRDRSSQSNNVSPNLSTNNNPNNNKNSPSTSSARFPSIYVRELEQLKDGIASTDTGNFFTSNISKEEMNKLNEIRNRDRDSQGVQSVESREVDNVGEVVDGGTEGYHEEEVETRVE